MTQDSASSSQRPLERLQAPADNDQRQYGQYGESTDWVEAGPVPLASPTSPLARGLAGLMICCPGCGLGYRGQDGYQQIPDGLPSAVVSESPYTVEKPPSMQISTPQQFTPSTLDIAPQSSFAFSQPNLTSPPLAGFPLLPNQPHPHVPALISDANTLQADGLPAPEYYPDESMKTEQELSNQALLVPDQVAQPDLSAVPYNANTSLVTPTNLTPQVMPTTLSITQYDIMISQQPQPLDEPVPQDGLPTAWADTPLPSQPQPPPPPVLAAAPARTPQPSYDVLMPSQRGGKRGPFKDLNLREQTAQTRKIGSCIRCRMQRIRCENNTEEDGGPCLTCKKVSNSRAGRFPCLRYKITDIRLFKPGQVPGYEWTRRWVNNISDPIQHWASEEIKTITLGDGLTNSHFVRVQVRRFIPQPGDKLERTWDYHGTKKSVKIPPYALVKLEDVKLAYNEHIRTSMRDAVFSMLGSPSGLLWQTYDWALNMVFDPMTHPESADLVGRTLMLWISCRLTTRSSYIVGAETLGMPPNILDETSPNPGMIPLPPVMGAQLDLVLIHHIQTRLRRELLDRLQKIVQKNKQSTWLVTYLVTFILLHNTALIIAHDQGYARKHGMKRRFAREEKVQEYHLGANILLAHFHYCNKGIYPFSESCKETELRTLAGLDERQIEFVRSTRTSASQHVKEWEVLRNGTAYDNDYFYISQLFEEGWQPRMMM